MGGGGGHFLSGSLLRVRRKQKENLVSTSVLAGAGGQADGLGRECPPELASPWGRVHNVSFAFELMLDGGLKKPKARPEDVVNLDLKSTLRVLYNLFTKYKNLE
uniref:Parvin beta n=1 Tax=Rousettus aegyptiacus TaxID=9407 RepID=A0A7J8JJ45_ROUAE|nr:parvin beta [Rousettus aegyptiacus]